MYEKLIFECHIGLQAAMYQFHTKMDAFQAKLDTNSKQTRQSWFQTDQLRTQIGRLSYKTKQFLGSWKWFLVQEGRLVWLSLKIL